VPALLNQRGRGVAKCLGMTAPLVEEGALAPVTKPTKPA